jgi:hypothetical protein
MKELRQYIRGFLLQEVMNKPAMLPDNVVVVIEGKSMLNGSGYFRVYYASKRHPKTPARDPYGKITFFQPNPLYRGNCDEAFVVGVATADDGWGPLLYDVAIEQATISGNGLTSDRESVSPDAQRVWNYYLNNRADVEEHQLDSLDNQLTPTDEDNCDQNIARGTITGMYSTWQDSALSKRYTKAPTTIEALEKAGKLIRL